MNETLPREPVLATIVDDSGPAPAEFAAPEAGPPEAGLPASGPPALEERIHALEVSVDHLKNSPELEERITTRVLERLPQAERGRWYKRLNPFRGASIPMPSGWVFVDLFNEVRFVVAMVLDRRYGMTWMSRAILIAALAIALTTSFWLSPLTLIPFVGTTLQFVLDKVLVLLCGGLIFKILHREVERYRKFLEAL
jgi:hypothetical protein